MDGWVAEYRMKRIGKADATCAITGYSVPFDGSSHTAAGSCKGVDGVTVLNLAGVNTKNTANLTMAQFNLNTINGTSCH